MRTIFGLTKFYYYHNLISEKNFRLVIKIWLNNGYSFNIIFNYIKKRFYVKFKRLNSKLVQISTNKNSSATKSLTTFFIVFYVPYVSISKILERFKKFFKNQT